MPLCGFALKILKKYAHHSLRCLFESTELAFLSTVSLHEVQGLRNSQAQCPGGMHAV